VRRRCLVLVIDAANVVGSRPTGWWRDRPGAARALHGQVAAALRAGRLEAPVVLVLEGKARDGVEAGEVDRVRVVHAPDSGDDAIVTLVEQAGADGEPVTVVTADRELRERTQRLRGGVVGPRWLLELLEVSE
jgi:hypothetical protein